MKPESAATKPGRESEVAKIPVKVAINERREGPLLSSSERNRERRRTGPARDGSTPAQASRAQSAVRLNNARKLQRTLYRVAKQQPERRFTLLTIRSVDGTFCMKPGNG